MNLLKMADMQQIDMIIRRHKWGWIGHILRKMSLQWPDKLCNGILWMVLEEKRGDLETNCGKGVQESKQNLA